MYKIFLRTFLLVLTILIVTIIYLSTIGIKTSYFNQFIINKINNIDKRLSAEINQVFLILNLKNKEIRIKSSDINLYLENHLIELEEINLKLDFVSFLNKKNSIKSLQIKSKENSLKNITKFAKSYKFNIPLILIEKKIKKGSIIIKTNFNFNQGNNEIKDYTIDGEIKSTYLDFNKDIKINDLNFNFKLKNKNYLFNNIIFDFNNIKIESENIKVKKKKKEYFINGKFKNKTDKIDLSSISKLTNLNIEEIIEKNRNINSENNFSFKLNEKYQVKNFNLNSKIFFEDLIVNYNFKKIRKIIPKYQDKIYFKNGILNLIYTPKETSLFGEANYSVKEDYDKIKFSFVKKEEKNYFDFEVGIKNIELIIKELDFEKVSKKSSKINIKGSYLQGKNFFFDEIKLTKNSEIISVQDLKLNKNFKVINFKEIYLNFLNTNNIQNNIKLITNGSGYNLIGETYDAATLIEKILQSNNDNATSLIFNNFNSIINININKIFIDKISFINEISGNINFTKNKITNLKLKSNYSNNKKLSLSIITNENNEKITTLHSSYPKPLMNRYKFIKGFEDGVLDFQSVKKNNISRSVLKIDNFKVKEVPILAKLLSLASLQGIADLLTGEGIRFTDFEMIFSNENKLMTIDEIYAIGPAISIMMKGYIEKDRLISLRGTLVPATTINRSIASIPLIGDILIGKKVGEGVFGVSFKIKGPPKKLKTTVNPIKTLTPRFISRTLEKIKKN